jgi:hypothetical protein
MKGRRAGEVLSDEALDALEMGLLRDKVALSRNADEILAGKDAGAMLRVYKDGSATLYLRTNPTRYEVLHESQHIEHLRQIGAQRYIEMRKTAAGNLGNAGKVSGTENSQWVTDAWLRFDAAWLRHRRWLEPNLVGRRLHAWLRKIACGC